jgi:hypothetical protein
MKRNKTAKTMTTFALNVIGYTGQEPQFRFAFTAESNEQANSKGFAWARYQGFGRNDYTVTVATEEQAQNIRNEYMSHLR